MNRFYRTAKLVGLWTLLLLLIFFGTPVLLLSGKAVKSTLELCQKTDLALCQEFKEPP